MTMVGSIYVQVKGDTTQFEKDMTHLKSWASKSGTEVSNALNNAITPKTASNGIKALSADLLRLAQSAKAPSGNFKATAATMAAGLSGVAKQAGITEAQYASMIEKMLRNRALTTATSSLKTLSNAMGLTARESKELAKQMGYTDIQANKMAGSLKNMKGGMGGVNTTAASFTRSIGMMTAELIGFGSAIAAAYTIKELGIAIYKTGQETLVADNAYKAITGSVHAANQEMEFLRKTSGELGLNFYNLREGYKGFLAAAKSSKIPMTEVRAIFGSISNAAAVMGLSSEKTSLVFLALEQMMSKGKISMEEIRRQMGDSLPGAFQIGAKAMGMTVEAFDKAVSAGEVYAEDFLPKFRVAMEDAFQGTIADSVKALNKLSEAWEDAKNQMAEGDFMGSIVDGMREITVMLKDPDLLRGLADFTGMMGKLVSLAGKYAAFQGKSFGSAMLKNEAGRLQGAGLADSGIWDLSEEQMRSMVNYYQEIEKLSASATEKMASNAENAKDQVVITTQEAKAAVLMAEAELKAFMSDQSSLFPGQSYYNDLADLETKVSELKTTLNEQLMQDSWLIKAKEEMKDLLKAANEMPLDPMIAKMEADRKEMNATADRIEEDVLKRINKTDRAKLASYEANLAAYRASGRDRKEIEEQLNADIQKIHDKRAAANKRAVDKIIADADRAAKEVIRAEREIQKEMETTSRIIADSFDVWGNSYDIDNGGIDPLQAAIDKMNNARNNKSYTDKYVNSFQTAANIEAQTVDDYGRWDDGLAEYQTMIDKQLELTAMLQTEYKKLTMSTTDYERDQLKQQYDDYAKLVEDKTLLNEWYAEKSKEITDKADENMMSGFADLISDYANTLTKMVTASEKSFSAITGEYIKMLGDMYLQKQVMEPLLSFGTGLINSGISFLTDSIFGGVNMGGGVAAGATELSNGAILNSSGVVYGMAGGGMINEHVVGIGQTSGSSYEFGEGGVPEAVISSKDFGSSSSKSGSEPVTNVTNVYIQAADSKSFNDMIKRNPGSIEMSINKALTGNSGLRKRLKGVL